MPIVIDGTSCRGDHFQNRFPEGVAVGYAHNAGQKYNQFKHGVPSEQLCISAPDLEGRSMADEPVILQFLPNKLSEEYNAEYFRASRAVGNQVSFSTLLFDSPSDIEEARVQFFDLDLNDGVKDFDFQRGTQHSEPESEMTFAVDKGEINLEVLFLDKLDGQFDGKIDENEAKAFYQNLYSGNVSQYETIKSSVLSRFETQFDELGGL